MKKMSFHLSLVFLITLSFLFPKHSVFAQKPISIGAGTYAEYPPLHEAEKPYYQGVDAWGDHTQKMINSTKYVVDPYTRALPSTDWYTTLVTRQYSGNLWSFPGVVRAQAYGIDISFPKEWSDDGREFIADSKLKISAEGFYSESAMLRNWSAWAIDFVLSDMNASDKNMVITMAHGVPFTWVETENLQPTISSETEMLYFDDAGSEITFPYTSDHIGVENEGEFYGVFAPDETVFEIVNEQLKVNLPNGSSYMVVGTMPAKTSLATFSTYAYAIPRDTDVTWDYNPETSNIAINWALQNENLKGEANLDQIHGWLPHHYRTTDLGFSFNGMEYATSRGIMKCAVGNSFTVNYKFNGILPNYPLPDDFTGDNPYRKTVMDTILLNYTGVTGYGSDTYWGGKDVLNYARYMQLAKQTGNMDEYKIFKERLVEAVTDWYTYYPGEDQNYFSWYTNWGSFLGHNTRDNNLPGIDYLQDHHFCYAYHVYAAALLFMDDPDLAEKYGDFSKMLVKDYANWDRNDNRFPLFRAMDPWAGHSYAGGMGDENGNGMESSSEAMLAWGSMFMLGTALNDVEMRDAAIFGYVQEAQATAEYWFDRQHIPENGGVGNYDYTKYDKPYNSNLVTNGIGWWTYFSGDNFWMHSIQWLPMSPMLKYLYEDTTFARWDFETMWSTMDEASKGWERFENNSIGNVPLSYMQIFDPQEAARIFDENWDAGKGMTRAPENNAFTYFFTHSHLSLGEILWDHHTNIPTSTVYLKGSEMTVAVYNPLETDTECRVYDDADNVIASFMAPSQKIIAHKLDAVLSSIEIKQDIKTVEQASSTQFTAVGYDQYGAEIDITASWNVSGGGTIDTEGIFTATTVGEHTVTAQVDAFVATAPIRVGEAPVLTSIELLPRILKANIGEDIQFTATALDQYGDEFEAALSWSVNKGGVITSEGLFTPESPSIDVLVTVTSTGISQADTFDVRFPLMNIAQGKDATALSNQGAGYEASMAVDGDYNSRWSSDWADPQWLMVDLGKLYEIENINLTWETAMAGDFTVELSEDGSTWNTVYSVTDNIKTYHDFDLNAIGQYVRVYGTERATGYGYSIFELEVYGVPYSSDGTPVVTSIVVEPSNVFIKDTVNQQFTAIGYDQYGDQIAITPSWEVIGKGIIDQTGKYTPTMGGTYTQPSFQVKATHDNMSGYGTVVVEEVIKPMEIILSPSSSRENRFLLPLGVSLEIEAEMLNVFGVSYQDNLIWSKNGVGALVGNGVYHATDIGDCMIFAKGSSGSACDTLFVTVSPVSEINLAFGKPTYTSTNENDQSTGAMAVDNVMNTMWNSISESDPQYITVDLKNIYALDSIVVFWENAYASNYRVEVSNDASNWAVIETVTSGNGGRDQFNTSESGRYVRIYGTARGTNYGYGIFEIQVYGNTIFPETPELDHISISPDPANVKSGSTLQFEAQGYDQYGFEFSAPIIWSVTGNGSISTDGLFTAGADGASTITATSGIVQQSIAASTGGTPVLSSIDITGSETGYIYQDIQFSGNPLDQFGDAVAATITWSSSGTASISSGGLFNASEVGTYTITAQSGALTSTFNVEIEPVFTGNLALEKPTTASSEVKPSYRAVDGILNEGWESDASDPQWVYVDLEDSYEISRVVLNWEAASANDYLIEVSDDASAWTTAATIIDNPGGGGENIVSTTGTGRYVRMYGQTRNTGYAYHLYEMEVYGYPAGITPEATSIEITPDPAATPVAQDLQLTGTIYDQLGGEFTGTIVWSVSGGGTISADGLFSPTETSGTYDVTATYNTLSTTTQITIGGTPTLSTLEINEQNSEINITETLQFTASGYDQFGNTIANNPSWSVDGGGSISATGLLTPSETGTFTVTADDNGVIATESFTVSLSNIALGKDVSASSNTADMSLVVDGNAGSRWTSASATEEWINVDLGGIYDLSNVTLNWEGAAAEVLDIQVSYDGIQWNTLVQETNGVAGINSYNIEAKAQYVQINCAEPLLVYPYSLYELEVYGTPSTEDPDLEKLRITPDPIMAKLGSTLQLTGLSYDQYGTLYPVSVTWSVTGGGTISAGGEISATQLGDYYVAANYSGMNAVYPFTVVSTAYLASIEIDQEATESELGTDVQFTATGYDQYGDEYALNGTWYSDKGSITQTGLLSTTALGTHNISYVDGSVVGNASLNVNSATDVNLALNKPVFFSSELIAAINVNDGDNGSRWESEHTDPQWITIDLEDNYDLYKVILRWETGSSKHFRIEMSDDNATWTSAYEETNNPEGEGVITTAYISGSGRYLRIYGESRNTPYGHSLFEIEAYGEVSTLPRTLTSIAVTPENAFIETSEQFQFKATAYDQYGIVMNTTPSWSTTGSATIDANGLFQAGVPADNYTVTASSGAVSTTVDVVVGGTPRIAEISVSPAEVVAGIGFPVQFTAEAIDQFGNPYPLSESWYTTGGGTINATGLFTPVTPGDYVIQVNDGSSIASAQVKVKQENIALFKPVYASDWPGQAPENAVDYDYTTRWESKHGYDDEWFYVDLEDTYTLYNVTINWESAAASAYEIQISDDASTWQTIYTEDNGVGGIDDIDLSGTGRYVRWQGVSRTTQWGYSFYEFEVYGYPSTSTLELARIEISPKTANLGVDAEKQFIAEGYDQFGNPFAITPSWSLNGVGTLSADGLYTATTIGEAEVVLTAGGLSVNAFASVDNQAILETIQISPVDADLEVENQLQYTALGFDQWDNPYSITPTWNTSGGGTIDENGLFTAAYKGTNAAGDYTISVSDDEVTTTTTLTITEQLVVSSIVVTPGYRQIADGHTLQLSAVAYDQYNNEIATTFNWSTSAGSIDQTGLLTPSGLGGYTISVSSVNVSGAATIEVVDAPVPVRIELTPGTSTIYLGKEVQFSAVVYDQDDNAIEEDIFWKTNGGVVDQLGLFKGTSIGDYTVTVYSSTLTESVQVSVESQEAKVATTILISQDDMSIDIDQEVGFAASVFDQFGSPMISPITWTSIGGGNITSEGVFYSSTPGNYKVVAVSDLLSDTVNVTVIDLVPTTIVINEAPLTIDLNQETTFTASVQDQYGNAMDAPISWSSNGGSISTAGVFSSSTEGVFEVYAQTGTIKDTVEVTVAKLLIIPTSIVIHEDPVTVDINEEATFTASVYDQYDELIASTITWSANGGTISTAGVFSSDVIGSYNVIAQNGNLRDTVVVTVEKILVIPTRISIDQAPLSILVDEETTITASVFDQYDDLMTATITWSSNGGTITTEGVFSSAITGVFEVYAVSGELKDTLEVTVALEPAIATTLVINEGPTSILIGDEVTFNATVFDQYGNPFNTTIYWSSNGGIITADGVFSSSSVGVYEILATSGALMDILEVTVSLEPAVATSLVINEEPSSILIDEELAFSANVFDQYDNPFAATITWSSNGGTITTEGVFSSTVAGTFKVFAHSGDLSDSVEVIVEENAVLVPAAIIINQSETEVTLGTEVSFSAIVYDQNAAEMDTTVIWSCDGGEITSEGVFSSTTVGNYIITATIGSITNTANVTVISDNSSNHETSITQMTVYPNPVTELLKINFMQEVSGKIVLFDIQGKLYFETDIFEQENIEIDMLDYPTGLYIIRIVGNNTIEKMVMKN